jgi:hypothetical protein
LEADQRLHEGNTRALEIDVGRRPGYALLRPPLCRFSSRDVDFVGALGDLRQDGHAVGPNFSEPKGNVKVVHFTSLPVPQFPNVEGRKQRRMPRQDSKVPFLSGNLDLIDLLVDEHAIGGHDLELEVGG